MINLRPIKQKDELFIQTVYRSTREEELKLTNWTEEQKRFFISMQSAAQLAEYKIKFPNGSFQIIIYKKKDVGRYYTWENETEIRLIDITLLPAYRNKGIGSYLLRELIKRSDKLKKKISLHVEPTNPALQLYLKEGFTHIKDNGRHYYMERLPVIK